MSEEQKRSWIYNSQEIFQDISDDKENVLMTIPPEVADAVGLQPGDIVKIEVGDKGTVIISKTDKKETYEQE